MNQKIRVLQILNLAGWGGACQIVYDLAKNLDKNQFEIKIASSPHPDTIFLKDLEKEGIEIFSIRHLKRWSSVLDDFLALWEILFLIIKLKPQIIHLHNSKAGFLGRWAGWFYKIFFFKFKKVKIYFTVHGWSFNSELKGWRVLFIFLEKIAAKITDKLIAVSEAVKNDGLKNRIAGAKKFLVIYNGVSAAAAESKNLIKKELGLELDSFVFGFVGRLSYPKRPDLLVTAASLLDQDSNCYFVIIGDGPLYKELKDLILKKGLEKKFLLLGQKSPAETQKIMNAFDSHLLITENEGLGLVVLETMALGLPNIASAVGGIKEIIEDGKNGFLVENKPEIISQKMLILKENKEIYQKMSQEALKTVEEKFSLQKMIERYEALYKEIKD